MRSDAIRVKTPKMRNTTSYYLSHGFPWVYTWIDMTPTLRHYVRINIAESDCDGVHLANLYNLELNG